MEGTAAAGCCPSADPHSRPSWRGLRAGGGEGEVFGSRVVLQSGHTQPPNGCTAFEGSRSAQHSVRVRECGSVEDASHK